MLRRPNSLRFKWIQVIPGALGRCISLCRWFHCVKSREYVLSTQSRKQGDISMLRFRFWLYCDLHFVVCCTYFSSFLNKVFFIGFPSVNILRNATWQSKQNFFFFLNKTAYNRDNNKAADIQIFNVAKGKYDVKPHLGKKCFWYFQREDCVALPSAGWKMSHGCWICKIWLKVLSCAHLFLLCLILKSKVGFLVFTALLFVL